MIESMVFEFRKDFFSPETAIVFVCCGQLMPDFQGRYIRIEEGGWYIMGCLVVSYSKDELGDTLLTSDVCPRAWLMLYG